MSAEDYNHIQIDIPSILFSAGRWETDLSDATNKLQLSLEVQEEGNEPLRAEQKKIIVSSF